MTYVAEEGIVCTKWDTICLILNRQAVPGEENGGGELVEDGGMRGVEVGVMEHTLKGKREGQ